MTDDDPLIPPSTRVFVLGNHVQACCWQVARLPLPGETLQATRFQMEAGGKGLNVAIGLRRLGAQVQALIGCGNDAAGTALLALLAAEGVDGSHVHRLPGAASGWGAGLIGADGRNCIAVYPGANLLLTAAHAEAARGAIEAAALVYGQFETALAAVEAAFDIAHRRGVPTVLNPSPWQAPPAGLRAGTHTLVANEVEAAALLGLPAGAGEDLPADADDAAREVAQRLPALTADWPALRRLVVTLGERGALGTERDGHGSWAVQHAPAQPITAVDTLGAGDGFACGYCAAVLAGQPLAAALAWGNLCGARVAAQRGVLQALPGAAWLRQALAPSGTGGPADQAASCMR